MWCNTGQIAWLKTTYIGVNAGTVQSFPSYEWIHDPMAVSKIHPQIAADLRDYCLQIIVQ